MFSYYLNTIIDHFNFKLSILVAILQVLKFDSKKFRILEILNFYPWEYLYGPPLTLTLTDDYKNVTALDLEPLPPEESFLIRTCILESRCMQLPLEDVHSKVCSKFLKRSSV